LPAVPENPEKLGRGRPPDQNARIPPGRFPAIPASVFVPNVQAARKGKHPVHDNELTMIPVQISVRRSPQREEVTDILLYPYLWKMGDASAFKKAGQPWDQFRRFIGHYSQASIDTTHASLQTIA